MKILKLWSLCITLLATACGSNNNSTVVSSDHELTYVKLMLQNPSCKIIENSNWGIRTNSLEISQSGNTVIASFRIENSFWSRFTQSVTAVRSSRSIKKTRVVQIGFGERGYIDEGGTTTVGLDSGADEYLKKLRILFEKAQTNDSTLEFSLYSCREEQSSCNSDSVQKLVHSTKDAIFISPDCKSSKYRFALIKQI